jgi:predicted Mrr-cat superfamily restriction endonuclease
MENVLEILNLGTDRKYWVVRCGQGANYLEHFSQNEIVAIGHMDRVTVKNSGYVTPDDIDVIKGHLSDYQTSLLAEDRETKAQSSKRLSTIKAFICEIEVGDTILSPKENNILVGTVTSQPFIEGNALNSKNANGELSINKLSYSLRRCVKWEGFHFKKSLPWHLRESLGSSQAIFRLDHHKELLEHWLYSTFIDGKSLHFSTKIEQSTNISQFHVTEFQRTIQKIELLADLILQNKFNIESETFEDDLEDLYLKYGFESKFTLTTKQSFTSPGNIWSTVTCADPKKLAIVAMLLQTSYGNAAPLIDKDMQISQIQIENTLKSAEWVKTTGNLDEHRKSLLAHLEKRRKTTVTVEEVKTPNNQKVIFPDVKEDGDTGK